MATIKEIAERAHVSLATVSRVLNKDKTIVVSDSVRNQIFSIAHEIGYVPVKLRHLSSGDGITIGVADWHIIRQECTNQKLSDLSEMAAQYCKFPVRFVRLFFEQDAEVDGIIALGDFSEAELDFLKRQSYSILFVGSNRKGYQYDRIIIDYEEGMKEMLAFFQENGCSSMGYIGSIYVNEKVTIGRKRMQAFRRLLEERGMFREECFFTGELSEKSGYQMIKEADTLPEVLLIGSDELEEGVMDALKERGMEPGKQIHLVIYKDIETAPFMPCDQDVVQIYTDFMWKSALQSLLDRITRKRTEVITMVFPARFQRAVKNG